MAETFGQRLCRIAQPLRPHIINRLESTGIQLEDPLDLKVLNSCIDHVMVRSNWKIHYLMNLARQHHPNYPTDEQDFDKRISAILKCQSTGSVTKLPIQAPPKPDIRLPWEPELKPEDIIQINWGYGGLEDGIALTPNP